MKLHRIDVERLVRIALEAVGPDDGIVCIIVPRELSDAAAALPEDVHDRMREATRAVIAAVVASR